MTELLFADVFIPDLGMSLDIVGKQIDAFLRGEVVDLESVFAKPVDASLEGLAFSDNDTAESELADESGAIPAGCECGDHDEVAVGALASGVAEGIGFSMRGRIVLLNAAVVARSEQGAVGAEDGCADRNPAFGESFSGLVDGHGEHVVRGKHAYRVQGEG